MCAAHRSDRSDPAVMKIRVALAAQSCMAAINRAVPPVSGLRMCCLVWLLRGTAGHR